MRYQRDVSSGFIAGTAGWKAGFLLAVLISTAVSAQGTASQPGGGRVVLSPTTPSYTTLMDIPGASREQQERELSEQTAAGCAASKLDATTLRLLTPLIEGLIAQSNYASAHSGRRVTVMDDPVLMVISRQADHLSQQLEDLYRNASPEADRALAYLLRLHFPYSDFDDGNIDCVLAQRCKKVQGLIDEMARCLPLTGFEPYPHQMVLPLAKVRDRIAAIPDSCSRFKGE